MVTRTNARLQGWFGDIPVKEARTDLPIQPSKLDIKRAKKNDPRCCIFANTCKRMYGSELVLFFKRYSYVDMLDPNGRRVVYRYENPENVRSAIVNFDNKTVAQLGDFTIRAPAKSRTLKARSTYKKSSKPRVAGSKVRAFKRAPVHGRYLAYLKATAPKAA